MRSIKKTLHQITTQLLDVPQDVVMDLPRMTWIGNVQLYIENHRGVLDFKPDMLRLQLTTGVVEIRGEALMIRAILPEEIFVEGTILSVSYINSNKG